eukprot:m.272452 g.272452  ORF g.272452 m.272452 type:complete len:410 (+) comp16107_c0_seq7:288-1517(+)
MTTLPEVVRAIQLLHSNKPGAKEELAALWQKQCQSAKDKNLRVHAGSPAMVPKRASAARPLSSLKTHLKPVTSAPAGTKPSVPITAPKPAIAIKRKDSPTKTQTKPERLAPLPISTAADALFGRSTIGASDGPADSPRKRARTEEAEVKRAVGVKAAPESDALEEHEDLQDRDDETDKKVYVVEKLLKHKMDRGGMVYLVKWAGYTAAEASWEPEENIGAKIVIEYKEDNDIPLSETDQEWLVHEAEGDFAEVYCTICKSYDSLDQNPIVICDECSCGYHSKCHEPRISLKVLEITDSEWLCADCKEGFVNSPRHIERSKPKHKDQGDDAGPASPSHTHLKDSSGISGVDADRKFKRDQPEKDRAGQDKRKRLLQEATGVPGNRNAFLKEMKSKMKRLRGRSTSRRGRW